VDHEAVTEVMQTEEVAEAEEVAQAEPTPMPVGIDTVRPSRVPEILVGTGMLLIVGAVAFAYMR
jgi:hypothetical protein